MYYVVELGIMLILGMMIGAKHVVFFGFEFGVVLDVMEFECIMVFFGVLMMF